MKTDKTDKENALDVAFRFGGTDGAHHKQWVIDRMVRMLTGSKEEYERWLVEYEEDGKYEWDTGIAP